MDMDNPFSLIQIYLDKFYFFFFLFVAGGGHHNLTA